LKPPTELLSSCPQRSLQVSDRPGLGSIRGISGRNRVSRPGVDTSISPCTPGRVWTWRTQMEGKGKTWRIHSETSSANFAPLAVIISVSRDFDFAEIFTHARSLRTLLWQFSFRSRRHQDCVNLLEADTIRRVLHSITANHDGHGIETPIFLRSTPSPLVLQLQFIVHHLFLIYPLGD